IIHYKPEPETCAVVRKDQIYLCDSGAQYLDGTTDTTRTWHFGEPTAEEKRAFTRVLQGHIAIDTAVVPNGTTGYVIDSFARRALWQDGLDYRHGTGHGVGHFLNVHEGPHGIGMRPTLNETPLKKGMTISNEPGYYADGRFGIRIEDIVIVRDASTPNNFGDKGYLAFEHVTMCPKQTKLVDPSLMAPWEVKWLDDYHQEVLEKVKPILEKFKDERAVKWLERECRPLKELSEWVSELDPNGSAAAKTLFVGASVVALYKLAGHVLREYIIIPKTTILRDIDSLHTPRKDGKIRGRAVVCGGSIAGLLAAAVCADHFESVTIVEAEAWANDNGTELPKTEDRVLRTSPHGYDTVTSPRTRVMQYYFGNLFQPPVYTAFGRLFPDLPRVMKELNLQSAVVVAKINMTFGRISLADPYATDDVTSGVPVMPCLTRGATEVILRKAVKEGCSNVEFKTGTVSGFRSKGSELGSVAVKVGGVEEQVEAAFVVDATGPSQMSHSKWLRNAGFSLPSDLRVEYDPILKYAASVWTIPSHLHSKWPAPGGFKSGFIYNMSGDAESGDPRCFGFAMAEHNQMVITIGGSSVTNLPTSSSQLRAYASDVYGARTIPDWVWKLFDFMEEYEEECKPFWVESRIPPMSWVQWHKIANGGVLPRNWIAVGDANMTLNPLSAQGIYKACVDSTTLDAVLRSIPVSSSSNLPNIPALFYGRQNPRVSSI
ncbi:hypothetical protein FRC01_009691, partial [Tulasnella sp. 417]